VSLLLGGIAMVGIGLALIGSTMDPSGVICDHGVMSPGDRCYGGVTSRSGGSERPPAWAEQDAATGSEFGPPLLVVGALLAVGGTAVLVRSQAVRAQAGTIAAAADWWSAPHWP